MPLLSLPLSRTRCAAFAVLTVFAAACAAPDDVSQEYHVVLTLGAPLVYRGDGTYARAELWHYTATDTTYVPNAVFTWSVGDGRVAGIRSSPDGYANIDGLARGTTGIYVEASAYGANASAGLGIRVADQVEFDSVSSQTVAWGGRLTLFGVRVGDPDNVSVRLNGVTLIPDTLSLVGDVDNTEQMSYFVPGGVTTGTLQLTGFGLIAIDSTPITVIPNELFEPNDLAPHVVPLDTAQPYPPVVDPATAGHPEIHFFEPQLLYEAPAGGDSITADWFHFVAPATNAQPWTFVYRSPAIPRRGAFGLPATLTAGVPTFDAGAFGFDFDAHALVSRCRGADFQFPVTVTPDSLSLSLRILPVSGVDFVSYSSNAGGYGLEVVTGYRTPAQTTPGFAVAPDKFEDNDFCEQADANFAIDSLKIALDSVFASPLSIDTPFEVDWFRFHVPTGGAVTLRTTPQTGFADAALDLYVYRQSDLNAIDALTGNTDASDSLSTALTAGDYYLVVVNTDGQATQYGLCIAEGAACPTVPGTARGPARGRRR